MPDDPGVAALTTDPESRYGVPSAPARPCGSSGPTQANGSGLLHNQMLDTWVVQERLGSGGMGTVYRCRNRDARRIQAAIKVLDPRLASSGSVRRRFVREAELLFELDHPHIVKVRNVRMDASPPFIEMAFVDGASLGEHLEVAPLTPGAAARIVGQVASALAHCHGRGVQHRDVKPANILVRGNHATLVDFGIAAEAGGTVSNGVATVGSLSYTPPEWGSDASDPTLWDAYSLGIVLFESLTGRMAFPPKPGAGIREEIVRQVDSRRGIQNLDPGPEHPEELRDLCRRLTETAPDARESDLSLVAEQLAAFCSGRDDCSLPERERRPGVSVDTIALPNDRVDLPTGDLGIFLDAGDAGGSAPQVAASPTVAGPEPFSSVATYDPVDGQPPGPARNGRSLRALGMVALVLGGAALAVVVTREPPGADASGSTAATSATTRAATPVQRPVIIRAEGEDHGLPFQVRVDGRAVSVGEPLVLPVGAHELMVELGPGCGAGAGAGPQCLTTSRTVSLVDGVGPADVSISLPALEPVPISFAPPLPDGARVRLDEGPWTEPAAVVAARGGVHEIVAQVGRCPDLPCGARCAAACAETSLDVTVPLATEGPHPVALELSRPARPARPAAAATSGRRITVAQFADYLSRRPQHQPAGMRASGVVPQGYLRGWDGATPPASLAASASVTRVSPAVARAACADRGGLQPSDAAPLSFKEEGFIDHEYRQKGDRVVLIRWDGREVLAPAGSVSPTAAVRCRR